MENNIDGYLRQLKVELKDCDRATVQDALSDAEEYLRNALDNLKTGKPEEKPESAFSSVVEEYGTPAEIADAYRKIEAHTSPSLAVRTPENNRPFLARFFGVVIEPRAWGALLYLLFTLATGIIYFTWTVTGISLSLGLLILIIGIPIAGLFILSTRGLALLEGRMVEALLGIRMPHRPLFSPKDKGIWAKFKALLIDRYTWFSMVYMLLQLPLGITYFSVFITLISTSLALVVAPIWAWAFSLPVFTSNGTQYILNGWVTPFLTVAGVILFFATLHLAKVIGSLHGKLAKAMLVRE
ncbi:MAG: sensor domain-containing protein [Dehalococcoidales bacterium]